MKSELSLDRAEYFSNGIAENNFVELLDHLAGAEFSEIASRALAGRALGILASHFSKIRSFGDLFFDAVAFGFGRYQDVACFCFHRGSTISRICGVGESILHTSHRIV